MTINKDITVITVNFNNASGLECTLRSLSISPTHPQEIIIIDAESTDESKSIAESFNDTLNINFLSQPDMGIYDGMNKGLRLVKTKLVHYLNSGDEIFGDPYKNLHNECLLEVKIFNEDKIFLGLDFLKGFGSAYNHQGIIFSSQHEPYDISFKFAADQNLIYKHFRQGLKELNITHLGGAKYYLGGVSTQKSLHGNIEIMRSLYSNKPHLWYFIILYIILKLFIPRRSRRFIYRLRNFIYKYNRFNTL